MLQVLLDEQGNDLAVCVVVDLACHRVLPLEAGRLLRVVVCVILDRLEDLCPQLRTKRAESALLLQILNHNILQVVHPTTNFLR